MQASADLYVTDPALVRVHRVARDGDDFNPSLREFRQQLGDNPELRRAHGRVVGRMREENAPAENATPSEEKGRIVKRMQRVSCKQGGEPRARKDKCHTFPQASRGN